MSTMVPMYGFGGGGGTGASLTVTAPAGCTVTVSKGGKTKTKVAGADGVAVFRGLATGQWTVNMTDGAQTAPTRTADITADYAITMSFFAATIHVTYPSGSTCTATDGVTTLTAPDTSGTWDCVVPNAGTWTVTVVERGWSDTVQIENDGDYTSVYLDKFYIYINGKLKLDIKNAYAGAWTNADGKLVGHANCGIGNALILGFDQSLSGFSTIQIKAKVPSRGGGSYYYGYVSRYNTWATCLDNRLATVSMTSPSETVYNLDVSSLGGDYYLWFAWHASGSNVDVEIIEIGCV